MSEPQRLLDRVRDAIRTRQYSRRTEDAHVGLIKFFHRSAATARPWVPTRSTRLYGGGLRLLEALAARQGCRFRGQPSHRAGAPRPRRRPDDDDLHPLLQERRAILEFKTHDVSLQLVARLASRHAGKQMTVLRSAEVEIIATQTDAVVLMMPGNPAETVELDREAIVAIVWRDR
jgi:hypothetical protein